MANPLNLTKLVRMSVSDVFCWLFTSAVNFFINKNCEYIHTNKYSPFFIFENQKAVVRGVLGKNLKTELFSYRLRIIKEKYKSV